MVISGNSGAGLIGTGPNLRVLNTHVGVDATGSKAVPNLQVAGIALDVTATGCTIGAANPGSLVVVSGNGGNGISSLAPGLLVQNTHVGVDRNGSRAIGCVVHI